MKKKERATRPGFAKLLDAWSPPDDAGQPIGCVATSFTFDAAFFEKECFARFLGLETDADEMPTAYLIEREEKLSQAKCAAALVDQHHARGIRNLRWDLLSSRPKRPSILHAKVSLLLWSQRARLIVASANLTEPGYRHNHEVFTVLDYFKDSASPLPLLDEFIQFLREIVEQTVRADATSPTVKRWNEFLDHVRTISRKWGTIGDERSSDQPRVFAVVTGLAETKRGSVFTQLDNNRSDRSPLHRAYVISPFFDDATNDNQPANEIWKLLKQRGKVEVQYQATVEPGSSEEHPQLQIPDVREAMPANRDCNTTFAKVKLEDDRPLHAKCLWFENDRTILHLIGSSNFTSAGLGLEGVRNIEANLCFEVNRGRQPKAEAASNAAWPDVVEFPKGVELRFKQRNDREEDASASNVEVLPDSFGEAIYRRDEQQQGWLEFTIRREPHSGWVLLVEESSEAFVGEIEWRQAGQPTAWPVRWERERPPSGFSVRWSANTDDVWWPVSVESSLSLPPPNELKNLPLELLIEVLTSSKPLHQVLAKLIERQSEAAESEVSSELDPHRKVDTSGFLLQRTRRVSWALTELRKRMERPVASEQALNWRLRGPVGVKALADAIGREAKSATEKAFLIAELCLELHRVQPTTEDEKCLPVKKVRAAIHEVIGELQPIACESLNVETTTKNETLAKYVESVFAKVWS